jgi:hypothetical protein
MKGLSCSWNERINSVKMLILPKAISTLNAIPTKILMRILHRNSKNNLKFIWKHKKPPNSQNILDQVDQSWGYHNP